MMNNLKFKSKLSILIFIIVTLQFSTSLIHANKLDSLKMRLDDSTIKVEERIDIHLSLIKHLKYRGVYVDSLLINGLDLAEHGGFNMRLARLYRSENVRNAYKRDFDGHLENIRKIDSLYKIIPDSFEVKYFILIETAYYHWSQQEFQESVDYYKKALDWAIKNGMDHQLGYLHSSLAHKQGLNNEFYDAINSYHKALEYEDVSKARVYGNMTNLYKRLEDWEHGIKYARLCHKNALEEEHENALIQSKVNEAILLLRLEQHDESIYILDSVFHDHSNPYRQKLLSLICSYLFENLLAKKEYKEILSYEHMLDSIKIKTWSYSSMISGIGLAYYHLDNNLKARKRCEKGMEVANRSGHLGDTKIACQCLSLVYQKSGDYKLATEILKKYNETVEKIDSRSKVMNLSRALNKQELKNQEEYLALEQKQTELLYQSKITQYNIAGGLGMVLFLFVGVFVYQLRKRNHKIKKQNEIISKALDEKDILLREIHHRVKNNLQVISSLLSLQSRQIDDKKIKRAISEGRNRVRSMALIHQNLYQQENLTGVSVKDYLDALTKELFDTYNVNEERVLLSLDIDDIDLDVDTMVPLGLIINELVSNALKHAFPDGEKGEIKVFLKEIDGGLNLMVEDNGVGVTKEEMAKSKSFGNRLITAFTAKLKADYKVVKDNGTRVKLSIVDYKKVA